MCVPSSKVGRIRKGRGAHACCFKEDSWKLYLLPYMLQKMSSLFWAAMCPARGQETSRRGRSLSRSVPSHLTWPPFHSLGSSHGGSLCSSSRPSSYLPRGLCSCQFICLARPSSNDVAGSLSSKTQLQRHFLRGTFFDKPRATHPLSCHTHCLLWSTHLHIHLCLPPLEQDFHKTGILVFTVIPLLPNTILSPQSTLKIGWIKERSTPNPTLFLPPLLPLVYVNTTLQKLTSVFRKTAYSCYSPPNKILKKTLFLK